MSHGFRFDLVDMRLFLNVAELESLSRGSERSNLSLAAASTRIKNLEANLGAQLLNRTSRGVTLTGPGQTFLHHARLVLQQIEHLNRDLRQYSQGVKGQIRVGANITALTDLLPAAMRIYLVGHPGIEVELRQYFSEDGVRAVLEGAVDLALVSCPVSDPQLEAITIRDERFVLITPPGHPLATRESVSFTEVIDHELIGLGDANTRHPQFTRIARDLGKPLNFRIHVNNFEDICRLVSDGVGVSPIPEQAALRYAPSIPFASVPFRDEWAIRQTRLVYRKPPAFPDFAWELIRIIRAEAAERASQTG